MAAEQFTRAGGEVTGLPISTIIYEQVVLGTRGMIKGLVRDRDLIWFLFPALLFVRAIAFAYTLFNLGTEKMKSKIERI